MADLYILVHEMKNGGLQPDAPALEHAAVQAFLARMQQVLSDSSGVQVLETLNALFKTLAPLGLKYDLWECQNLYFRIGRAKHAAMRERAAAADPVAARWLVAFEELGANLGVKCSC
jgi:hypothetical protein